MHTENKGKNTLPHPPGNESLGVWVCNKCGWTYPNPHPSAKHRRNHKKHCGKIEGLKLISREDNKTHSSDDSSDEDLKFLPVKSILETSKLEEEAVPGSQRSDSGGNSCKTDVEGSRVESGRESEAGEGIKSSEVEVFADAVADFADALLLSPITTAAATTGAVPVAADGVGESEDIVQELKDVTHDDQVQNPDSSESMMGPLDSGMQSQDHVLCSTADSSDVPHLDNKSGPSAELTEDRNSAACCLSPRTSAVEHESSLNGSTRQTQTDSGENMTDCSRTGAALVIDAVGSAKSGVDGENLLAGAMLTEPELGGSETESKLQKGLGFDEVDAPHTLTDATTLIMSDASLEDTVVASKELNSTVYHVQEDEAVALGQEKPHDDPSLNSHSGTVIVKGGGENLGVLEDDSQEKSQDDPSLNSHSGPVIVKGGSENLGALEAATQFPELTRPIDSIGEENANCRNDQNDAIRTDNALGTADENSPTVSVVTGGMKPEVCEDIKPTELVVPLTYTSDRAADEVEDSAGESIPDSNDTGAPISSSPELVCEDLVGSDRLEINSYPTGGESIGTKADALGDAVLGSTEMDAKPSQSWENRADCSVGGEEQSENKLSHETPPETLMTGVAVDCRVAVDCKVEERTVTSSDGQETVCEHSRVDSADTGGDIGQEVSTDENSRASPNFPSSESTRNVSELTKPQFPADVASNELEIPSNIAEKENIICITKPAFPEAVILGSNGMDASKNHLVDISSCPFEQQGHQSEVLQEHPKEVSAANQGDPSVSKTDDQIEMESRVEPCEESNSDHASVLVMDASVDSISQTDSLEGCWGSISEGTVPSTQDVMVPITEAAPADIAAQIVTKEAPGDVDLKMLSALDVHRNNTDLFEAPSFMTLVEPGRAECRQSVNTEIQPKDTGLDSPPLQAGWFPSLVQVSKESRGRKKNEEIIAKVVNWSSSGNPSGHTPLRSLLVEANLESKQKKMPPSTTTDHIEEQKLSSQDDKSFKAGNNDNKAQQPMAVKLNYAPPGSHGNPPAAAVQKEWNSPARFTDGKREKRKGRRRPYWVTFACCSSSFN